MTEHPLSDDTRRVLLDHVENGTLDPNDELSTTEVERLVKFLDVPRAVVVPVGENDHDNEGTRKLACPACGNSTFGYKENCVDYREPGGQSGDETGGTVTVLTTSHDGEGDSDPGLFCDDWRGSGCGRPIELPEGWEISWG